MRGKWTKRLAQFHVQVLAMRAEIEAMRDSAEAEFDERSERWQESRSGVEAEADIDHLILAADACGDLDTALEDALALTEPSQGEK